MNVLSDLFATTFHQQIHNNMIEQEQVILQQHQNSSVSLDSAYTDDYKVESRRNKRNNKFKVIKCPCGLKHHSKTQMRTHKTRCNYRLQLKTRIQRRKQEEQFLQNNHDLQYRDQLQLLKKRVQYLENQDSIPHRYEMDPYMRAKKMFQKYGSAFSGIVVNKIATSLQHAIQASVKVDQIQNSIATAIMSKLQSLNFDDCVLQLSDQLYKAHRILVEQNIQKTSKTKKYNERAFNFLSQFTQFELLTQIKVFDELLKLEVTQRKNVIRYFSKIRKVDPFFTKYPPLPKIYKTVPKGILLSKTTIQQAARQVRQLYLKEDVTLATDMWIVICLGLRFHDLLKVYFSVDGKLVKFIRLKEQKNSNICQRFIPRSLVQMITYGKITYPASQKRLRSAVKECLKRFKSSYGFKHRALTAILTALHRSNPLARMHSRPDMTLNHYINKNDEQFLNNAFNIGIKFQFSSQLSKIIEDRNILLNLSGNGPEVKLLSDHELGEITLQCQNILKDRLQISALDGDLDIAKENILPPESLEELFESALISSNHQIEMLNQRYENLYEAIGSLDQGHQIIAATELLVEHEGQDVDDQLIIDKLSEVSQRAVHLYEVNSEKSFECTSHLISTISFRSKVQSEDGQMQQGQKEEDLLEVVMTKNKQGYAVSTKNLAINQKRLAAIKAQQKLQRRKYYHKRLPPNCLSCKQNNIISKLCSMQSGIGCNKCNWKVDQVSNLYPLRTDIMIQSLSPDTIEGYPCVKLANRKNNLIDKVNDVFPGKYSSHSMYSADFPKEMYTYCKEACKRFGKQIEKCRIKIQYLPLQILESSIKGAGLGLFCTENIEKFRLILTYVGVIGTSFSIIDKENNDSLFQAGWINHINKKGISQHSQMLIDGTALVNASRFINSSNSLRGANLIASTTFWKGEIVIYFFTSKDVTAGQELFFFYGQKYWQKSTNKKSKANELDSQSELQS